MVLRNVKQSTVLCFIESVIFFVTVKYYKWEARESVFCRLKWCRKLMRSKKNSCHSIII